MFKLSRKLLLTNSVIMPQAMTSATNGNQPFIDQLLDAFPSLKVKDKLAVEQKLQDITKGGHKKLQLIVDFDNTLTRHHKNGKLIDCSWGVMENSPLLPHNYTEKTNALRAKYLPIEQDPHLSVQEKIPYMVEWYTQANQLLQETGIDRSMFKEFVKTSNVEFRDNTKTMLDSLNQCQVPLLVMSAGLGDILEEVMNAFGLYHKSNTKVVSNFLSYDDNGKVIGLEGEMIHVYNKNESAIHGSEYFQKLKGHSNIILLGDSIGDLKMADGAAEAETVLKIGFLNNMETAEIRLPSFLEGFDIVLVDDQTMNVPLQILKHVQGMEILPYTD